MKLNKKLSLILMGFMIILGLINILPSIKASYLEQTISTEADQDSYVSSHYPDATNGEDHLLYCGFYSPYVFESYFRFSFRDKPSNFKKAEILLDISGFSVIENSCIVTVCLIEESWNASTLNWNNKPDKNQNITNILVSTTDTLRFDIANLVSGRTDISICVYIAPENYNDSYLYLVSREAYRLDGSTPKLIWTYDGFIPNNITVYGPTSSTQIQTGDDLSIVWTNTGIIDIVIISIFKGSSLKHSFMQNNTHYSLWYIPEDTETGSNWRVKIQNATDQREFGWSDFFTIIANTDSPDRGSPSIPGYLIEFIIATWFSWTAFMIYMRKRNSK